MIIKNILSSYLEFVCYGPAIRIFTNISKVPFGHLRSQGHNSVVYVDDSYLQGDTYQACLANILDTIKLLTELGFVIHPDKSVLILSQTNNCFSWICYIIKGYNTVIN